MKNTLSMMNEALFQVTSVTCLVSGVSNTEVSTSLAGVTLHTEHLDIAVGIYYIYTYIVIYYYCYCYFYLVESFQPIQELR